MSETLLRIRAVQAITGLSRSAIYANPDPRSVRISDRSVAWTRSSVEAWIAEKIAASAQQ